MGALRIGLALAAVLAGPPLYALVRTGELDSAGALIRGLIVALVCTAGVSYILKLAGGYAEDVHRRQMIAELTAAIDAANAPDQPGSAPGGTTIPGQQGSPTDSAAHTPST